MRLLFLLMALGLGASAQTLTLEDALRSASARNPRLAASAASREAAEARAVQARWDRVGRLDLAVQWAPALQNPAFTFPGAPPAVPPQRFTLDLQYKNQIGITLDQPLWTWGSLAGRARSAGLHAEAEASGTVRERQRVAFDATRAYLQVRQAEAAVAVADRAVEQEQAFLDVARARFRAAQAPRLDTLKAELALSTATSELVARRNEVKLAREDLVTATSDPRFRDFPLAPAPEAVAPQGDDAALVAGALARRADLDALRREARALHVEADAQRASGRPTLNLVGNIAQQKDTAGGLLQNENRTYFLGVALRWEGFSASRSRARGMERDAQAGERRAQGEALEDQIAHEVRTARLQLEDAQAQVALAGTSLAQAEEQARVARLAYREGVGTAVETQDAELALTRARYQVLATALARETALAQVRLALGEEPR